MLWLYKGDAKAGAYFADGGASFKTSSGWSDAESRNIEGFAVPIGGKGAAAAAPVTANATNAPVKEERDCSVEYAKV